MAQSYVWKVTYTYRKNILSGRKTFSKVFTNKVEAMIFENQMRNDPHTRLVKLEKWFG